jgi:hypothetical protein
MHIKIIRAFFNNVFDTENFRAQPLTEDSGKVHGYAVFGFVNVPHRNGVKSVQMQVKVSVITDETNHPEIIECEGIASLGTWDIADGLVLSRCTVRIINKNGKAASIISGALRVVDCNDIEVGGDLEAEILRDPDDACRMYIGTLVANAFLFIGTKPAKPDKTNILFQGATIKLELCTKPHDSSKPLPYFIDELNELLFQSEETIPLGSWRISGIGKDPLTMSISINALSPGLVQTNLLVSPARLRIPFLGEDTYLFIAGPNPGGFFPINIRGKWDSFISSTPRISFVASADTNGPMIIEGASFLTGRFKAEGLSRAALSLSSELVDATAFPSGAWPQKMPDQKLSLAFEDTGTPDLVFKFYPLIIDGFRISNGKGKNNILKAALCHRGLLFKKGYSVSHESSPRKSRRLPEFIIDGSCRIWVNSGEKEIELAEWVEMVMQGEIV